MATVAFELKPFEPTAQTAALSIKGNVSRKKNVLSVRYHLSGNLGQIAIPAIGTGGARQDRLWEKTCFEFFLMQPQAEATIGATVSEETVTSKETMGNYWEFNLSPNGDWNVFALSGYRQGLNAESAFSRLPFEAWQGFQGLQLESVIDVSKLVAADQPVLLNVSAVVVDKAGNEMFWAIAHPDDQADFHHPQSFLLKL